MSGFSAASQSSNWPCLARMPLTFQVAIFILRTSHGRQNPEQSILVLFPCFRDSVACLWLPMVDHRDRLLVRARGRHIDKKPSATSNVIRTNRDPEIKQPRERVHAC